MPLIKVGLSPSTKIVFICVNKRSLKMIKNIFYFILKAFFVLEKLTSLSWLFGYVEKRLDKKAKINCKIYDFTDWTKNNQNTHIIQYLKK